jgi:uncharacterized membrane protein YcaP (DUF421 family)
MLVTRFIGRKAISQMTFFDFAVAITLGTLAASVGMSTNTSATSAALVMVSFAVLGVMTDVFHLKSYAFRKLVNSEPVVLVQNGEIIKKNMAQTRITLDSLNTLLREKNVFNIADVEYAIFENDGKLSVLLKSQKQPVTPSDLELQTAYKGLVTDVVIDGNIMHQNLRSANLDENWLRKELENNGIKDHKKVFFAALDTSGNLYISQGLKD